MTHREWEAAVKAMGAAGKRDGTAAGGWVAGENTPEGTLRALLRMWDDGDPAAPSAPMPFSGEWAGDPTPEDVIGCETDCDPESLSDWERDDLVTEYEDAYLEAWQAEAERTVRGLLPDDE